MNLSLSPSLFLSFSTSGSDCRERMSWASSTPGKCSERTWRYFIWILKKSTKSEKRKIEGRRKCLSKAAKTS